MRSSCFAQGQDHRQSLREEIWRKVDKQYEGEHWTVEALEDPTADLTVVNMSFATIQTIKPYITDQEPRFYLEPFARMPPGCRAALQEVFLNRLWRHPPVGAQVALRAATFDYLTFGDGFMKATYRISDRIRRRGEPADFVELFVDRVTPWDVWIDPYSDALDTARWVAHRIWLTEDEAELTSDSRSPPASSSPIVGLTTTIAVTGPTPACPTVNVGPAHRVLRRHQWGHVLLPHRTSTTAERQRIDQLPWQVVDDMRVPIVQMPNYDISDRPWHMGDLEQIAKLQNELNKTRSELMTHRRRNVAKTSSARAPRRRRRAPPSNHPSSTSSSRSTPRSRCRTWSSLPASPHHIGQLPGLPGDQRRHP